MEGQGLIRLDSGFVFDYSHFLANGTVTRRDVEVMKGRFTQAAEHIQHMRIAGEVKGHLSKDGTPEQVLFTELPYVQEGHLNSPASIQRLKEFGQSLRNTVDMVLSFGIGGSYLGNKVLFDVHCGPLWNEKSREERNGYPKFYFGGNNLDPRSTADLIEHVLREAARKKADTGEAYKVTIVVISKSGSTIDTMATFMTVYAALLNRAEIDVEVVAVTDPATGPNATLLNRLAAEQGWQTFSVPDGVGGRFSVFSEVGLVTAACIGFDIDAFLAGARAMDEACQTAEVWENPALLNSVLKYLAAEKYGRQIEVFMPYADCLKSVAEWYTQLLAESLGKRLDRDGKEIYYGRTPVPAVGTTDMHSQTQLHQDGRRDKVVQFVQVASWEQDLKIPNVFPSYGKLAEVADIPLSQALAFALEANALALASDGRSSAVFVLPTLNAFHLGELLYLLALSIAYEGELANVDAFDQPGVETYKRLMNQKLKEVKKRQG